VFGLAAPWASVPIQIGSSAQEPALYVSGRHGCGVDHIILLKISINLFFYYLEMPRAGINISTQNVHSEHLGQIWILVKSMI